MIFIMVLCIIFAIVFVYLNEGYLISPPILLLASLLIGCTAILININDWQVIIYQSFVIYVTIAAISFLLSYFLITRALFWKRLSSHRFAWFDIGIQGAYRYPQLAICVASCICLGLAIALTIANVDFSDSSKSFLRTIYDSRLSFESNFFLHQPFKIIEALAHIAFFEFLLRRYSMHDKQVSLQILLPLIPFFLCMIISTDRNIFIRFALYCWTLWMLFFYCYMGNKRGSYRTIVRVTVVAILIGALCFFALGKMKNYTSNLHRMLGIYAGSGLYNFNLSIDRVLSGPFYYGQKTFFALFGVLKRFGVPIATIDVNSGNGEYITYTSPNGYVYSSNIYSAMMPYAEDFGLLGAIIFPGLMGCFYAFLFPFGTKRSIEISYENRRILDSKQMARNRIQAGSFHWILFAMLIYPLIFFAIAEQFFLRIHLGIVYEIGWMLLLYIFIYKRGTIRFFHR